MLLVAILAGCTAAPQLVGLPRTMAALGDSITRGVNVDGSGEALGSAWSTGLDGRDDVESHAERLIALGAPLRSEGVHNDARSGARVSDLPRQADLAVAQGAEYVTILIGANDACARTGATSLDSFRASFHDAAESLRGGLPADARVLVLSVPDVTRLHAVLNDSSSARSAWALFRACPAALGAEATNESRAQVRDRIASYNEALGAEAAAFGFAFDDGAVFEELYGIEMVSTVDAFHPGEKGQARLAEAAWAVAKFST